MWRGRNWVSRGGIATGLACGVPLANLYLATQIDAFAKTSVFNISGYQRYIDDSFMVSDAPSEALASAMSALIPGVTWEVAHHGTCVPYLDLEIGIGVSRSLVFDLYRKPGNSYMYIPRCSAHPPAVQAATARGEALRILRTARVGSRPRHVRILEDALYNRGHSRSRIRSLVSSVFPSRFRKIKPWYAASRAPIGFKVLYSSKTNARFIRATLRRHQAILGMCKVRLVWKLQPNLFRRMFRYNWQRYRVGLEGVSF